VVYRGVYFFSLDAANPVAVALGRGIFKLPYFRARMRLRIAENAIRYTSQRTHSGAPPASCERGIGRLARSTAPRRGSLEHWLSERYCLYTVDSGGRAVRTHIHHPQWQLQPAEAVFERNTMAAAHALVLPPMEPLLHFSPPPGCDRVAAP